MNTLRAIEIKILKAPRDKSAVEYLDADEREIYADELARRFNHRSALLFTLDKVKMKKFEEQMRWKYEL